MSTTPVDLEQLARREYAYGFVSDLAPRGLSEAVPGGLEHAVQEAAEECPGECIFIEE